MNKKSANILMIVVLSVAMLLGVAEAYIVIPGNYHLLTKTPAERRAEKRYLQNQKDYQVYLDNWVVQNRTACNNFYEYQSVVLDSLRADCATKSDSLYQKAERCWNLAAKLNLRVQELDSLLASGVVGTDRDSIIAQRQKYDKNYKAMVWLACCYLREVDNVWKQHKQKSDSVANETYEPTNMLDFGQFLASRDAIGKEK